MKNKLKNILVVSIILLGLVLNSRVLADPSDEYEEIKKQIEALSLDRCNKLSGQARIDCINELISELNRLNAELEKFAQEIGAKTEELQKEIQSLNNQIGYLNAQIEKTQIEIEIKEKEITLLELDISKIEEEIKGKEQEIEDAIAQIATSVRALYEYDSQNLVRLTLEDGTLSDFFDEIVYINDLQDSISKALEELKADKKILELNKEAIGERKKAMSQAQNELVTEISRLDSDRQQKAILLEITKGDEAEYQRMMEKIKESKSLAVANLREVEAEYIRLIGTTASCGNFPYYSQKDGWGNMNCGDSIYDKGCAVTSTAMVFTYYGKLVTPTAIAKCCTLSSNCYIKWYDAGEKYDFYVYVGGKSLFGKGYPAIIHTDLYGGPYGHYVVVIKKVSNGNYLIADPWSGGCWVLNENDANIDQVVIYKPK